MIHYHGTPLTPHEKLLTLAGRHFCVCFLEPRDLPTVLRIGQSVMGDNGAFSAHTRGVVMDWPGYYAWCEPWLRPPHWAVVPDVIGGTVEQNLTLAAQWPHGKHVSAVVWHLHEPLEHLAVLADTWPRVCFGSSGEFWDPGTDAWNGRVDTAWNMLESTGRRPWVHMLRAMQQASEGDWPFASADSVTVARNHAAVPTQGRHEKDPSRMAAEIDARNPPPVWECRPIQLELVA